MASKEITDRIREIVHRSAEKFSQDMVELDTYNPKIIGMMFESMSDFCNEVLKEIKQDSFNTNIDAIEFTAMAMHCIYRTIQLNIHSLAYLKQIVKAEEAKKN